MQAAVPQQRTIDFIVRTATREDIPAAADFLSENAALEDTTDSLTASEFESWWDSPFNFSVYTLAFLRNEDGSEGRLVGMLETTRRPGQDALWGWIQVQPGYRLAGIGRALYAEYEKRAAEEKMPFMRVGSSQKATRLIEFLERRGYSLERYFWDMRLPAEVSVGRPEYPAGISVRTFVPGQDEDLFTHVRNVTFAEHYGSVPRTPEQTMHMVQEVHFRPDGLFFAFEGDQIAGFCFTGMDPREWERLGYRVGHIHTLGVMPAYRGRGLGRALLLEGVGFLRRYVPLVELGVEGKNERALALYRSAGFEEHRAWANMEKRAGPPSRPDAWSVS